ncbi:MAG: ADP-ribosylglycohydrolase family protein [Bacteroidales bacterium]|nr:ADP-ribosylglycohydrolase family protein [Bacteroidales bacterium]
MLGAITGDIIGSRFEFNGIKSTDFDLLGRGCRYTDDSAMTIAVAEWLLDDPAHTPEALEQKMVKYGELDPGAGFGGKFYNWLFNPVKLWPDGIRRPYNSWGNGSAMRVSAVGWMFDSLEETERVAEISASITHNHPEGIKGAQATAAAVFMARNGASKEMVRSYISNKFGYDLNRTIEQIRPSYHFEVSCQESVPEAIIAFLDSTDYESSIRLAVSLGGDADTQACIAGGIAEAFYGMPDDLVEDIGYHLPPIYKTNIIRLADYSAYRSHREQLRRCWRK